jgi:hypothetical protein
MTLQFINTAMAQDSVLVGSTLERVTNEVMAVTCLHPRTMQPFVLVDTPGFDEVETIDDILVRIEEWLKKT